MDYCTGDVEDKGKCHSQFEGHMGPSFSINFMDSLHT